VRRWIKNPVRDKPEILSEGRFGCGPGASDVAPTVSALYGRRTVYLDPTLSASSSLSGSSFSPQSRGLPAK
jgi:hypothetical protein